MATLQQHAGKFFCTECCPDGFDTICNYPYAVACSDCGESIGDDGAEPAPEPETGNTYYRDGVCRESDAVVSNERAAEAILAARDVK